MVKLGSFALAMAVGQAAAAPSLDKRQSMADIGMLLSGKAYKFMGSPNASKYFSLEKQPWKRRQLTCSPYSQNSSSFGSLLGRQCQQCWRIAILDGWLDER
jgi:hypothetical protein